MYIEDDEDISRQPETKKLTATTDTQNNTISKKSSSEQLVIFPKILEPLDLNSNEVPRDLWTNKVEFLLSIIGYVVDLGKTTYYRKKRHDYFKFD